MARAEEAREGAVIQVLDVAQAPEKKSKPKKSLITAIATLGSGVLLLIYVFIRHGLRHASRSARTAEQLANIKRSLNIKI